MTVSRPTSKRRSTRRSSFLRIVRTVLTKPKDFFSREERRSHAWKELLLYLGIFAVLASLFFTPRRMDQTRELLLKQPLPLDISFNVTIGAAILFFIGNAVLLIILTSFKYWIVHKYVRLYNKEAPFKKTYAELTYGGTPGWIAIPFFILALTMTIIAIEHEHFLFWITAAVCAACWLTLEGYSIYLRVYALSRVQKITKVQAFLCAYVWGLSTYLVVLFLIELALIAATLIILVLAGAITPEQLMAIGV